MESPTAMTTTHDWSAAVSPRVSEPTLAGRLASFWLVSLQRRLYRRAE
jgi:hypothetical protein